MRRAVTGRRDGRDQRGLVDQEGDRVARPIAGGAPGKTLVGRAEAATTLHPPVQSGK
ncbi:hypothetical protein [Halobellus sp. GM3]|uniref:hypothetical protein n=1 Tax=Halobellus sp. GM3 TaxID=3458410 RepID=UPI00403D5A30